MKKSLPGINIFWLFVEAAIVDSASRSTFKVYYAIDNGGEAYNEILHLAFPEY